MPILKRRLDICGRERTWEYVIENSQRQFFVTARQVGREEPMFECSCGATLNDDEQPSFSIEGLYHGDRTRSCAHIGEVQRDLLIARQAAAQMIP